MYKIHQLSGVLIAPNHFRATKSLRDGGHLLFESDKQGSSGLFKETIRSTYSNKPVLSLSNSKVAIIFFIFIFFFKGTNGELALDVRDANVSITCQDKLSQIAYWKQKSKATLPISWALSREITFMYSSTVSEGVHNVRVCVCLDAKVVYKEILHVHVNNLEVTTHIHTHVPHCTVQ